MLVHICCRVDSEYFFKKLAQIYPNEKFIGYFYDPNIHPYSEFLLRFEEVKFSCKKLGIKLIKGEYDFTHWLNFVKGLENEPEKGKRCEFCFDFRLENTAHLAKKLGEKKISTTLLMSPKKSHSQLTNSLQKIALKHSLEFIAPDFRKNSGSAEQFSLAKENHFYKQNYCGCIYALSKQQIYQNAHLTQLQSPLTRQILPNSIEEKLKFYKKVRNLVENGAKFCIVKERFLNYRLLMGFVKFDEKIVPSYFVYMSKFRREFAKFILTNSSEIVFCKDEIKILSINAFNKLANTDFQSVCQMLEKPLKISKELSFRSKFLGKFSLSPIIIVDKIYPCKAQIYAKFEIFDDVGEKYIKIS